MDVSDRRMQVQLTPEAKIAAEFLFYQSDFCVCGLCQRSVSQGQDLATGFDDPEGLGKSTAGSKNRF